MMSRRRMMMAQSDSNIAYEAWNLVFDGTNYIDTGIKLFSAENVNRDFEIILNISYDGIATGTFMNAMLEKSPYPGMVARTPSNLTTLEIMVGNVAILRSYFKAWVDKDVYIHRVNNVFSAWLDGDSAGTTATETKTHDVPVTIGAGLNGSLQPWRYWAGTINHIKIEWLS